MNILYKIKTLLLSVPFTRNLNNLRYEPLSLFYRPEDLTPEYYNKIKDLGDIELEHQIGRLTNFKKILQEIDEQELSGDLIEFGTWRGFSLLWTAYLAERIGLFGRKIIGLDGFVGLPDDDGVFKKGAFDDATYKLCSRNIQYSPDLYEITKKNVSVEQFMYSQKTEILKYLTFLNAQKFVFVHIDCDIASSAKEIFSILRDGELFADRCYLLFDDYGCDSGLSKVVNAFMEELKKRWRVEEHSRTKLTKNFKLVKI